MEKTRLTPDFTLVVIGGSAGSLDVILKIVTALPFISHLATVIIVHRKNDGESILTDLLSTRTKLVVKEIQFPLDLFDLLFPVQLKLVEYYRHH